MRACDKCGLAPSRQFLQAPALAPNASRWKDACMDIDYWKCPNCGYRVLCVQYYSARFDYPCRCGMTLGDFHAVYKRLPTTLAPRLETGLSKSDNESNPAVSSG